MEEEVGCGLNASYCVLMLMLATVQVCVDAGCLVRYCVLRTGSVWIGFCVR